MKKGVTTFGKKKFFSSVNLIRQKKRGGSVLQKKGKRNEGRGDNNTHSVFHTHKYIIAFSLALSLSRSLALSLSHTHTLALPLSRSRARALSLPLS